MLAAFGSKTVLGWTLPKRYLCILFSRQSIDEARSTELCRGGCGKTGATSEAECFLLKHCLPTSSGSYHLLLGLGYHKRTNRGRRVNFDQLRRGLHRQGLTSKYPAYKIN